MNKARTADRRRNRGFDETHQALIETAVRLISEKGVEALSISALAREVGLNRTTIYYHFPSREAMLAAVKDWSSAQIDRGMDSGAPRQERMEAITAFVLENPELVKLWIDDFLAPGDIRERYPRWNELVSGMARSFAELGMDVDAEVYSVMMLTSAIIGPRVLKNSVMRDVDEAEIRRKVIAEQRRVLIRDFGQG